MTDTGLASERLHDDIGTLTLNEACRLARRPIAAMSARRAQRDQDPDTLTLLTNDHWNSLSCATHCKAIENEKMNRKNMV